MGLRAVAAVIDVSVAAPVLSGIVAGWVKVVSMGTSP